MERSSGLFDATSPLFQNAIYSCLGLLLFFTACGIIWDYGYMRHWKKKTEMGKACEQHFSLSQAGDHYWKGLFYRHPALPTVALLYVMLSSYAV